MPDEYDLKEEYSEKKDRDRRAKVLRSEDNWVQTESKDNVYRVYAMKKTKGATEEVNE